MTMTERLPLTVAACRSGEFSWGDALARHVFRLASGVRSVGVEVQCSRFPSIMTVPRKTWSVMPQHMHFSFRSIYG